jgi:hypothetical protein
MEKTEVVKNIHGKIEDWHRDLNNGIAPTPWEADSNGNITDALGRPLFTPNLVSVSQGFVGSNIDNAVLICDLVNNFGEYDQSYNLQRLQKIAVDWADGEFPNRVPAMALLKMFGEIGEVIDKPSDAMEWADVLILFLDVAKLCGISGDDLTVAFIKKMEINKKRVWNENELGVISHVTPEEQKSDNFLDAPFSHMIGQDEMMAVSITGHSKTVSGGTIK